MTALAIILALALVAAVLYAADQRAQRLRGERDRLASEAADRAAREVRAADAEHGVAVATAEARADAAQNADLLAWLDAHREPKS